MDSTYTIAQQSIRDDYFFSMEQQDEFVDRTGRFCLTMLLRTVFALNPSATRQDALIALDMCNPTTVRIQFANSRKLTLECGEHVLNADGSLTEIA